MLLSSAAPICFTPIPPGAKQAAVLTDTCATHMLQSVNPHQIIDPCMALLQRPAMTRLLLEIQSP